MSLDAPAQTTPPITSLDELVAWFRVGEKAAERHRIGLESEKIGVLAATGEPASLDRIGRILAAEASASGGQLLSENGTAIGVQLADHSLALEPGGQFELSGTPSSQLSPLAAELHAHLVQARRLSEPQGLAWLGVGYRPFGERTAVPWLPRGRYGLMRRRMPGRFAHDMMQMTASVQVNFDFADEGDLAAKVSCATAVSPIVSALYANAPLRDNRPTGMKSFRYFLWRDVDSARSGLLRVMFEPGFTYRRYLDWALAAPLLFVRRQGSYVDPEGRTFRDLLREGFLDAPATMMDFVDLLSTLFPEIRVKRVVEVRGADAVNEPLTVALPALWTGLLYDAAACAEARQLLNVSFDQLLAFQEEVGREALGARLGSATALDLARDLLRIAEDGLRRRIERGAGQPADLAMLDPIRAIAATGRTPADEILDIHAASSGDRARIIEALRL
jgi:glutamate--cysteine ligase